MAKTISITEGGAVAPDLHADGAVAGVELIDPRNDGFAMLVAFARERDLSYDDLFSFG